MLNFPCNLARNIASHSMKKLAFHNSLRWKMIILPILTTSPVHFCFQGLGECNFLNLGVKGLTHLSGLRSMQTCWCTCWRKDGGLSWTTCCILSRVWKCAIKKFSVSIIMWDDRAPIATKMHSKWTDWNQDRSHFGSQPESGMLKDERIKASQVYWQYVSGKPV